MGTRDHSSGFEELSVSECQELLQAKSVGRVGVCTSEGPQILPVNYAVVEGDVVFRTTSDGPLASSASDQVVAFQIDEADEFLQSGWSVLMVGTAHLVDESSELKELLGWGGPQPWAPGNRTTVVRVAPTRLTGRRVHLV